MKRENHNHMFRLATVSYMFYGDIKFALLGLTFMLIVSSVGIVIVNKGVIYEFF